MDDLLNFEVINLQLHVSMALVHGTFLIITQSRLINRTLRLVCIHYVVVAHQFLTGIQYIAHEFHMGDQSLSHPLVLTVFDCP